MCVRSFETDLHDSSTGAVAELLDISDLASNQTFISSVHESAFNLWSTGGFANLTIQQVITNVSVSTSNAGVLAQLYYINEGTVLGLSPVWDFRATPNFEGVENAIMVGTALWELPDVDPTENIPWFHYLNLDGAIASEVYQIYTVGGVAPPSVSLQRFTGAFAFDPADGCAYVLLSLYSISASAVRRTISPSSMQLNIGSTAAPWDWAPTVPIPPTVPPLLTLPTPPTLPVLPTLPAFRAIPRGLRSVEAVEALQALETLEGIKWVPSTYRLPIVCITCWYHRSTIFPLKGMLENTLSFSTHTLVSSSVHCRVCLYQLRGYTIYRFASHSHACPPAFGLVHRLADLGGILIRVRAGEGTIAKFPR